MQERVNHIITALLILFSIGICTQSYAQLPTRDTLAYVERIPDAAYFEELRSEKAFGYAPDNLVDNEVVKFTFLDKIKEFLMVTMGLYRAMPILIRIAFWGFLVFIIYIAVTKTRIYQVFYSEKQFIKPVTELAEEEEYIEDFDAAIQQEVADGQFRKAIRFQYLKLLDGLSSAEMIQFSKEKTNRQYSMELKDSVIQADFIVLTANYNYIWYGGHSISQKQYLKIAEVFERVNLKLHDAA